MKTLVDATTLMAQCQSPHPPVLLDCSFDLADPDAGERAWRQAHLPGAHYLHLDRDLSGAKTDAQGRFRGRHPLPDRGRPCCAAWASAASARPRRWCATTPRAGPTPRAPGGCCAGWATTTSPCSTAAWRRGAPPAARSTPHRRAPWPPQHRTRCSPPRCRRSTPTRCVPAWGGWRWSMPAPASASAARSNRWTTPPGTSPAHATAASRTTWPPTAASRMCRQLRAEWRPARRRRAASVHHCGSGVTACHNLLALAHAGLGDGHAVPGLLERVVEPTLRARRPKLEAGASAVLASRAQWLASLTPHQGTHHVQAHPRSHRRFRHHRQGGADRAATWPVQGGGQLFTISVKEPFPYSAISEMQPVPPQEFYDAQERIAAARVKYGQSTPHRRPAWPAARTRSKPCTPGRRSSTTPRRSNATWS